MNKTIENIMVSIASSVVTIEISKDCYLPAYKVFIGSSRELKACRQMQVASIGKVVMVNPNHAYPQFLFIANRDLQKALEHGAIEMYVTESGDDLIRA